MSASDHLNLHPLCTIRRQLDNVYSGFKFCPSMLETVGIRVLTRNLRDFHSLLLFSHIKFVPLLDVHQSQIASAKILMYLESSWYT
jgi:hypothetical protein